MPTEQEIWQEVYGDAYEELVRKPKTRARSLVAYHLRVGNIQRKSCEYMDCAVKKVDAHHPDYDEPLTVLWLCRRHHQQLHAALA